MHNKTRKPDTTNDFQPLIDQGYVYSCEEVYLGKKGKLISQDGNDVVEWFYTERDGIYSKIKRKDPWKILFEYTNGSFFINENREDVCKELSELKNRLDDLKNKSTNEQCEDTYLELERTIFPTIIRPVTLLPKKIRPFLSAIEKNEKQDQLYVSGSLSCCGEDSFEISVFGTVKQYLFSKMSLFENDNGIALMALCCQCGNTISVFDSRNDGYDHNEVPRNESELPLQQIICRKCHRKSFRVNIRYEYSDIREIEDDNDFSWIWISLTCSTCGAAYKNFIDCETS